MTYEGFRLKVQKVWRKGFANYHRKKLKNTDFTIISNNCWGGMIYESYNLQKKTPTVGMFFMAEDYIKLLSHLKEYLNAELIFIEPQSSRWKKEVSSDSRFGLYPVGNLKILRGEVQEDIEIFFLHYHSEDEAGKKWKQRIERINWDCMLVKFNDQNGCTEEHIRKFDQLDFKNKICFTAKEHPQSKTVFRIQAPKSHTFIRASYEPFGKRITDILNHL